MRNLNYRLLDADMFSYYPAPKFWFRGHYDHYLRRLRDLNGFVFRFWKIGVSCHIGVGCYSRMMDFVVETLGLCNPIYIHYTIYRWRLKDLLRNNRGPFKWVIFWYDEYQEWLENGGC